METESKEKETAKATKKATTKKPTTKKPRTKKMEAKVEEEETYAIDQSTAHADAPEFVGVKVGNMEISQETLDAIDRGELTFRMWSGLANEEYKSAFATYLESKGKLFDFFRGNLEEKDTFTNNVQREKYLDGTTGGDPIGVYTRFTGTINGREITYVRCYCPSTDRMFFLCTENKDNAKDAIASLCEVPEVLYDEVEEIYRQGEVYSFKLTEKGYSLIDNKKVDYNRKRHFTGEDYFNKIRYEY